MNNIFNLKSYTTFLSRNKLYTAINVFGLSVSLMFVVMIGLYVEHEYSIDSRHTKAERIYGLGIRTQEGEPLFMGTNPMIAKRLEGRYPEIEKMCIMSSYKNEKVNLSDDKLLNTNILYASPTFYDFFDFDLTQGDKRTALADNGSAVISRKYANTLFGNANPIGQTITYRDSLKLKVTGVFDEMRHSSIPEFDIVANFEQMRTIEPQAFAEKINTISNYYVLFLTKPGSDLMNRNKDMCDFITTFCPFGVNEVKMPFDLAPFKGSYFSDTDSNLMTRGNKQMVNILLLVGLIVLVFAVMNYINLTVAQASYRAREMATRRLLGSQRSEIMMRLVVESVALCFMSLIISLLLSWAVLPFFSKLLETDIRIADLFNVLDIAVLIAIVVVVGVLAGIIPATVLSRAKPIDVVRGTFRRHTKMVLSRVFITVQMVVTISLIASALTMRWQVDHLVTMPKGYDSENVMSIIFPGDSVKEQAFRNELRALPCVKAAALCNMTPIGGYLLMTLDIDGVEQQYYYMEGDSCFMQVLGIQPKTKYNVEAREYGYVNSALLSLEKLPKNTPYYYGVEVKDHVPVAGIIEGMRLGMPDVSNYFFEDTPLAIHIDKNWTHSDSKWGGNLLIKVEGNATDAANEVFAAYKRVYKKEYQWKEDTFFDERIRAAYKDQTRITTIVSMFSALAVLISFLGLLAMSSYFVQQRRKEIAVRKVFGSTSRQMLRRLISTFLTYVLVAFVVSVPIVWKTMGEWLSHYTDRISFIPALLVGGVFCLIVSLAAVFSYSYMAANENPIKNIKAE